MHPSPGRPAACHHSQQQERRAPENASSKPVVEPTPDEETNQGRRDNDPTQNADLADKAHGGGLAFLAPMLTALALPANRSSQAVWELLPRRILASAHEPPSLVPGRSGRR